MPNNGPMVVVRYLAYQPLFCAKHYISGGCNATAYQYLGENPAFRTDVGNDHFLP